MKASRRAPLGLALALCFVLPLSLSAQSDVNEATALGATPSPNTGPVAPDFGGEVGLFTVPTGDTLPAGAFSFGLYVTNTKLVAGVDPDSPVPSQNSLYEQSSFRGSLGWGMTKHIELFVSAGEDKYESRGGWINGWVNSRPFPVPFDQSEPSKIRVGAKVALWSPASAFRLAAYFAADAPVANDPGNVNTDTTDWEWGLSGSMGVVTGFVGYTLAGHRTTPNDLEVIQVSNRLRFAVGTDVPFGPVHWITELDRNVFDGGAVNQPDYSNFLTGVRFYIGHSGWAFSAAGGFNVDMIVKSGTGPSPFGGLASLTYAPFPPPPPPPRPLPPVETHAEETPPASAEAGAAPAPAPTAAQAPAAPPAPQSKATTDIIQFDKGGARLTNIAKAILDGVALRMKNDLNSTAVITGYSDNAGSDEANMKISQQRADAAKNYLVERHGIDGARIQTAAKGSAEPVADNSSAEGRAKNRRAVIVVTFLSGS